MSAIKTVGKIFGILILILGLSLMIGSYAMSQVTGPEIIKTVAKAAIQQSSPINQTQMDQIKSALVLMCANNTGTIAVPMGTSGTTLNVDCSKVPTMTNNDVYDLMANSLAQAFAAQQPNCPDFISCVRANDMSVFATNMAVQFFMTMMYIGLGLLILGLVILVVTLRKLADILKPLGIAMIVSGLLLLIISLVAPNMMISSMADQTKQIVMPIIARLASITIMAGAIVLILGIVFLVIGIVLGKKKGVTLSVSKPTPKEEAKPKKKKSRGKGEVNLD